MALWTQEEAVNYQAARDCINACIAILSTEIHEESSKPSPSAQKLDAMRAKRLRLGAERSNLRLKDHEAIARVRKEYGATYRTHGSQDQASA